jgi:DNA-binding SARP family transcriptional activator
VSVNRPVSAVELADLAWDGRTPVHPRAALQSGISRLRRLLGQEAVETVASGYRICAATDDLDLLKFDHMVKAADEHVADGAEEGALAALEEALGLWRDPLLGNVSSGVLHHDVVPQLTERRLDAQEKRAQLCLRLGRHESLTGELAELTRIFPFRERLTGSLMLALYRSDRQAGALAAYETLRRRLSEELGIDPAAELQDLYLSILRGDPDLRVIPGHQARPVAQLAAGDGGTAAPFQAGGGGATIVPRQLPADIADFTGREVELSAVRDLLTAGGAATGTRIAIVAGPGGAGKSALAVRASHGIADLFPDGQLYVNLQGASARPAEPGEVLSRFLRGLGVAGSAIPADVDERSAMYRSLVADRRVLVLLDDAEDERQLRQLMPAGAQCGVVVTARGRITGLPGTHPIQLGMLDDAEAVLLLSFIAGTNRVRGEPQGARALARLCGGLPLALRIAGARLAARPHWRLSSLVDRLEDGRRRLGELSHGDLDVRASLALSYQGLVPAAQVLLRRIGLLDAPDFPAWAAAALLDTSLVEADQLIDSLVDAQLLEVTGRAVTGGHRYRCHDLIRDFARELALTDDKAASRAALGRAFGALLDLVEQAHRQIYGGDYSILHGQAPRWRAVDMDQGQLANDAPLAWLEGERMFIMAAVLQGAAAGMDELCWDLAWTAATLFEAGNYLENWPAAQQQALAATRLAGNQRGEAAMLASLGACMLAKHSYETAAWTTSVCAVAALCAYATPVTGPVVHHSGGRNSVHSRPLSPRTSRLASGPAVASPNWQICA